MAVQNFGTGGGGFQLSPGVNISEVDLTTVTPSVDTTVGAFAGVFRWGPANERVLITSENNLVGTFGKPTNINAETFFSAANFLSYSNALYVVRAINTTTQFAAIGGANNSAVPSALLTVFNNDDYFNKENSWGATGVQFIARWPGTLGNSLKVSVCESAAQYTTNTDLRTLTYTAFSGNTSPALWNGANTRFTIAVGSNLGTITLDGAGTSTGRAEGNTVLYANSLVNISSALEPIANTFAIGDYIVVTAGGSTQSLKITNKSILVGNVSNAQTGVGFINFTFDQPLKISQSISSNTVTRFWEYYTTVDGPPGRSNYVAVSGNTALQIANAAAQQDEVHVVVVDEDGGFTGSPGVVLEAWQGLSRATDAKNSDGTTNFYKTVVNQQSSYVWFADDRAGSASNTAVNVASAAATAPLTASLAGAIDQSETDIAFTAIATAYDQFVSPEDVDISLVVTGSARGGVNGEQLPNYLIDNIAEVRKDCMVFVSPQKADVVNTTTPDTNIINFRNSLRGSSYAVLDSGYKQQYDKYNDVYRWIPLNGDIAGLCVRTDRARDPWFSPAGTARGQIKNVVKLAYNPNRAQRDQLYKNNINPVISEPAQGTILYGDKTLLAKPSAFDRINVRRLFIVLEKSISIAAKSLLFEFNDEFTRAQFRNLVEPFLRDVQGRRGIYDFRVVCDDTNNTPEVIDNNRFVGDIYIKPARAINYIQLNFVAVRSGVEFSEIVG